MTARAVVEPTRSWLSAYLVTMRPYLFFVSGAAGLLGEALVESRSAWLRAAVFLPLFLAYGFGQALTDTFQTDTDSVSAPYRPLVRGEISVNAVRAASLAGLAGSAIVLCLASGWVAIPATLAVLGLLLYTPCKRKYWAGPACNAAVVALLPIIACVALAKQPWIALGDWRLLWGVLSVFGSYAVFVVIGYLKDVEADRMTGYDTLPVHFGVKPAVVASAAFATVGLLASCVLVGAQWRAVVSFSRAFPSMLFWGLGVAGLLVCHAQAWKVTRDDEAHPCIAWSVRSFLALHLGEALAIDPSLVVVALALAISFELVLSLRPQRSQI